MTISTDAMPESGYADVNGVHLYYEIHGTGSPSSCCTAAC